MTLPAYRVRKRAHDDTCRFDTKSPEFRKVRELFSAKKADEAYPILTALMRASWRGERGWKR